MTLTSICLATQQGVALNRISGYANSLERLRAMLGTDSSPVSNSTTPNWDQLYVWQTPIMLLNVSVILFIVGLIIMVFDELARDLWSERSIKVGRLRRSSGWDLLLTKANGGRWSYWLQWGAHFLDSTTWLALCCYIDALSRRSRRGGWLEESATIYCRKS